MYRRAPPGIKPITYLPQSAGSKRRDVQGKTTRSVQIAPRVLCATHDRARSSKWEAAEGGRATGRANRTCSATSPSESSVIPESTDVSPARPDGRNTARLVLGRCLRECQARRSEWTVPGGEGWESAHMSRYVHGLPRMHRQIARVSLRESLRWRRGSGYARESIR